MCSVKGKLEIAQGTASDTVRSAEELREGIFTKIEEVSSHGDSSENLATKTHEALYQANDLTVRHDSGIDMRQGPSIFGLEPYDKKRGHYEATKKNQVTPEVKERSRKMTPFRAWPLYLKSISTKKCAGFPEKTSKKIVRKRSTPMKASTVGSYAQPRTRRKKKKTIERRQNSKKKTVENQTQTEERETETKLDNNLNFKFSGYLHGRTKLE